MVVALDLGFTWQVSHSVILLNKDITPLLNSKEYYISFAI